MLVWQIELEKIFNANFPAVHPFRQISPEGVAFYGAGSMGQMALDLSNSAKMKPHYIVDKNVTGTLNGIKIISPEQIPKDDFTKLTFVICVATVPVGPIVDFLLGLGCEDVRHFYDYSEVVFSWQMSNGWAVPNPTEEEKEKIKNIFKSLEHDDYSVAHYLQFLWWRLRRKEVIYPKYPVLSDGKFFDSLNFPLLSENETFVDCGAYHGEIIMDFIKKTKGKFNNILAFEPDLINKRVLEENIASGYTNITLLDKGVSDKCDRVKFQDGFGYASRVNAEGNKEIEIVTMDSMLQIQPTIIKIHIEGDELAALNGAKETIKKYRPILMVLADHSFDGLYKIPEAMLEQENYKLFFNLHDYCGNSAIFYAIPKEKIRG